MEIIPVAQDTPTPTPASKAAGNAQRKVWGQLCQPTPGFLELVGPLITAHCRLLFLLESTLARQVPRCMAQDVGVKEVKRL